MSISSESLRDHIYPCEERMTFTAPFVGDTTLAQFGKVSPLTFPLLTYSWTFIHCYIPVLAFTDLLLIILGRVSPEPKISHIMSTYWPINKII